METQAALPHRRHEDHQLALNPFSRGFFEKGALKGLIFTLFKYIARVYIPPVSPPVHVRGMSGEVKVKVCGKLYVVFERRGRVWEVEVPGVYAVPVPRGAEGSAYALTTDVVNVNGEVTDVGLLLVGEPEDIAEWALSAALKGDITDEAWRLALEALRKGRARVEIRELPL